ncbi:MAG: hypothetical protein AVDCRST_MAG85-3333, partial [uncultured Solirubrobacteraceae bacterium]
RFLRRHVVLDDPPAGTGAPDRRQVDALLARHPARDRRRLDVVRGDRRRRGGIGGGGARGLAGLLRDRGERGDSVRGRLRRGLGRGRRRRGSVGRIAQRGHDLADLQRRALAGDDRQHAVGLGLV